MNIQGIGLLSTAYPIFDSGKASVAGSEQKQPAGKIEEDWQIAQFKEEHNPTAQKVEQIMGKFMGGKDLTSQELDFLAKNAPGSYQAVREVLQERQYLEMRLAAAKSKLEVVQAHTEGLTLIKETKGTGEVEKQNALKTLMRVNQVGDAYGEFVSTAEYRDLEDEEDKREEISQELKEQDQQSEQVTGEQITGQEIPEEPKGEEQETADEGEQDQPLMREVVDSEQSSVEFRRKVHDLYKSNMHKFSQAEREEPSVIPK